MIRNVLTTVNCPNIIPVTMLKANAGKGSGKGGGRGR